MKIFNLPDLGEGLPEGEIHKWHVKEGDTIKADQLMVEIETAKAVVEVPSPFDGKITKLYGQEGDIIETGKPLIAFASDNDSESEQSDKSATVVGNIPTEDKLITEAATGITPTQSANTNVKMLPAVRALAKQLNVDLSTITPQKAGVITADDVKAAAAQSTTSLENLEPLRGIRRTMAQSMAAAHQQVAAATIVDDADIQEWQVDNDITSRLIRAVCVACKKEPALNAWYDDKQMARQIHQQVDLGLALDTPGGLFVPVIKDAAKLGSDQLRNEINQLKQQAKTRDIPQDKLTGSTIMLSNFGMLAGRYATPVIVPPNAAIVGAGRIHDTVLAINGQASVRRIIPLSLTFDHRVVTGGEAARFLAAMIEDLRAVN